MTSEIFNVNTEDWLSNFMIVTFFTTSTNSPTNDVYYTVEPRRG